MPNEVWVTLAIIGAGYVIYIITRTLGRLSDYAEDVNAPKAFQLLAFVFLKIFFLISCITIIPLIIMGVDDLLSRPGFRTLEKEIYQEVRAKYEAEIQALTKRCERAQEKEQSYISQVKELRAENENLRSDIAALTIIQEENL